MIRRILVGGFSGMKQNTKRYGRSLSFSIVCCLASLLILVSIFMVHYLFYDINRIKGEELISSSTSPTGEYELSVYRNNGGATTGYAVLCTAREVSTDKERNIYWQYRIEDATVEWESDYIVVINNIRLDVRKDAYDYRRADK